ncbi:Carboxylesterase 1 [Glycine soja]|uniref:Carboxylesterase 1 n=1 Tax=Glycine soja TaxID=3848 RepID=A0A445J186_GLYSO|nr:Carboxylesterase 1 [Glycine soja]
MFHHFCAPMSAAFPAVVTSVKYHLAPEHHFTTTYDDTVEALDVRATIAYFMGLRAIDMARDLEPLKIRGLILCQVFFGGTQRCESEIRLKDDEVVPLCVIDMFWELALPVGVNRDHEYCNLRVEKWVGKLGMMKELGWRVLVSGNDGDPVIDREKDLVVLLEEKGVDVVSDFDIDGCHGVEYADESKANQLILVVKRFVS